MSSKSGSTSEAVLVCDGREVCSLEIAGTSAARLTGLLKRDTIDGALLLPRTNSVHTLGMRFAIDVAFCRRDGLVVDVVSMKPNRIGRPRVRASYVVESAAGAFEKWGVVKGVLLGVKT